MADCPDYRLILGDCRDVLPTILDKSIDAVICDPPYPMIQRPYGRMTEAEWHDMMKVVVPECRRVLKPSGSAVFILQPNSERVGRMRLWLWDFVSWAGRKWNLIQDVYWWNYAAMPTGGATEFGLCRSSVKPCVWLGPEDCYRDQGGVLWDESPYGESERRIRRARISGHSSGDHRVHRVNRDLSYLASSRRGGVTPFNLIPVQGGDRWNGGGTHGHTAATPLDLVDWWVRYISPPDGVVCDPFCGSGTTGLAALKRGRSFIGIEAMPEYVAIAQRRLDALAAESPLFAGLGSAPPAD